MITLLEKTSCLPELPVEPLAVSRKLGYSDKAPVGSHKFQALRSRVIPHHWSRRASSPCGSISRRSHAPKLSVSLQRTRYFTVYTIALVLAIYYFDVGELDIIDSISLVFATITGGGFVPVSTFIIVDNVEQLVILMIGMILSALPFAFHYGIFSREIKARQLTSPILAYFAFMTMSIVLFAILAEPPPATNQQQWWITSVFHVISASTTTGFQLVNLESISVEAKIILVIVMMIGGMAYSTAGGIKFDRLILVLRTLLKGNMFFHIRKGKEIFTSAYISDITTT